MGKQVRANNGKQLNLTMFTIICSCLFKYYDQCLLVFTYVYHIIHLFNYVY